MRKRRKLSTKSTKPFCMRAKPKKDTSYQLLKHTTQHTTTQRKAQHNTTQNTTHTPNNALPPLTCCSHDVRSSQDQRSREKTGACTSASPELMDMLASCSNCITRNKNGKGTEEKKRKAGTKKKSKKKKQRARAKTRGCLFVVWDEAGGEK